MCNGKDSSPQFYTKGGRGHWAVYYTSPQSLSIVPWLNNFRDFIEFSLVVLLIWVLKTFQSRILIYRRGNFVCHHWGYANPFRFYWEHFPIDRQLMFLGINRDDVNCLSYLPII